MINPTRFSRATLIETSQLKQAALSFVSLFRSDARPLTDFPPASEILSDENKYTCLKKLKEIKISPRELSDENQKKAAVLIPLCITEKELSFLYTLRRANLKRHRGQVSFPGGIKDETDGTLEETALRETEEELGIERSSVSVWGSGSIVVGAEFSVLPVLGFLGELNLKDLRPNPDEVEVPFTLPLKHFCRPDNCRYTQFRVGSKEGYVLPAYLNGPFRVWGITALITHVVLLSLIPDYYKHSLRYMRPVKTKS